MKDEIGEYIEIFEVIGAHNNSRHQAVVARAANNETFVKILKKISLLKHQDDRSHRIYRAYSEKMREKYCREMLGISSEEFSEMISKQFEADNNYYQGDSELLNHEKKIDEALGAKLDEMMDKHPGIFKTWYAENGFNYKYFDCFFPRVSKAYITFGDQK